MKDRNSDELAIVLADLNARQQEIVDRGRSENYVLVLYFTVLGGIVAGITYLQSLPTKLDAAQASLGHASGISSLIDVHFLPTIVLFGSLATMALPVDIAHIGFATEVRRFYIQQNLEPRLRALLPTRPHSSPFTFEGHDRVEHHWWPNWLTVVRGGFMWLPWLILLGYYIVLRNRFPSASSVETGIDIAIFVLQGIAIVLYIATIIRTGAILERSRLMAEASTPPVRTRPNQL